MNLHILMFFHSTLQMEYNVIRNTNRVAIFISYNSNNNNNEYIFNIVQF